MGVLTISKGAASEAEAAAHRTRVPFLHFFDGFRTSHEIDKIEEIPQVVIKEIFDRGFVRAQRSRALSPDRPFIRGTAQNSDVYFQAREAANPYYLAAPRIVHNLMDEFARLTGRKYNLFDYTGAPDAERVLVLMGSGAETTYLSKETRYATVTKRDGEATCALLEEAEQDVRTRWQIYEKLARYFPTTKQT